MKGKNEWNKKTWLIYLTMIIFVILGATYFGIGKLNKSRTSTSIGGESIKLFSADENVISPNGNSTWAKSHTLTFELDSGKYVIVPENGVMTDEYKNFQKGDSITLSGVTGKYSIQVIYNSTDGEVSYLSDPFYLDNTLTKVGSVEISIGSINGAVYETKEVKGDDGVYYEGGYVNGNLYIHKVDGSDAQSGHKSTTYTVSKVLDDDTEIVIGNSSVEDTIIETPGTYKIVVTTEDNLGNKGTKTYLIHKGTESLVEISNNGNSDYELSGSTTVTIDEEKAEGLKFYYAWAEEGKTPTDYTEFKNGQTLSISGVSGDYVLWIKIVDASGAETIIKSKVFHLAGKVTTMGTMIFKYENENGADYTPGEYSNKNIYLRIKDQGKDEHGGKVTSTYKITKKVDGSSDIVIGEYTNESTVLINDGEYTVTLTSKNELGASSYETYKVLIDKTAPTITFSGLDDYVSTGKVGVTIKDNGDSSSGINLENCRFYWTRNDKTPTYEDFFGTSDGNYRGGLNATSTIISTPSGESGMWCLWILAEDKLGNYSIGNSIKIIDDGNISRLDNTPPIPGSLYMTEQTEEAKEYKNGTYTKESVKLELLNGYDADSGVKTNTYSIEKNSSSYASNLNEDTVLTEHGQYDITITTIDNNDNSATSNYQVYIDKKAPDISFIPADKTDYAKKHEVQVVLDDENYSGVNDSSIITKWIGYNPKMYSNIEEVLKIIGDINNVNIEELQKKGIYISDTKLIENKATTPENATGNYHLYIYVEDNVGNSNTVISDAYLVDNENPTVPEITAYKKELTGNYVLYYGEIVNTEVKVVASNSESLSGVDKYQYTISKDAGLSWSNWTDATMNENNEGELVISEEGTYLVKFRAVAELLDGTLVSKETQNLVVIIDKSGPEFEFANYETGENGTINYVKSILVRITGVEKGTSAINTNTLKYEWIKFDSVEEYNRFKEQGNTLEELKSKMTQNAKSFANGEEIPSPEGANGIYSLFAYGEDMVGNANISYSNIYRLGTSSQGVEDILIKDNYIKIKPNTKLSDFTTKIKNYIKGTTYKVYDKAGNIINDNGKVLTTNCVLDVDGKEYTIAVYGDLNEDGVLDVIDLSNMINHQADIKYLEGAKLIAADIDNDNDVNLIDLSRMMQIIVGLIEL